jgi:hypothetical protein
LSPVSGGLRWSKKVTKGKHKVAKIRVRREWARTPSQKPHSTKKGKKGYKRTRLKANTLEEEQT